EGALRWSSSFPLLSRGISARRLPVLPHSLRWLAMLVISFGDDPPGRPRGCPHADTFLHPAELGCARAGTGTLALTNESDKTARMVLLGGPPFDEEIVMWWNFIGLSHADIVRARDSSDRFGAFEGYPGAAFPLPLF
ncbi:pirin-like C-terminal cupin domain-containing protein, partial [Saccharopolyspora shandongensis]|uniref:pirin-like C-terminal cupin domain-containing protein n=1 Tax=Saccharopolyspora shandongensis TaxID=418495 RepID=UPI003447001C